MADNRSKEKLSKLKAEAANEIGAEQFTKENNNQYKGDVKSRINGAEGGPIGGLMVKKIIETEEKKLIKEYKDVKK